MSRELLRRAVAAELGALLDLGVHWLPLRPLPPGETATGTQDAGGSHEDPAAALAEIAERVRACTRCQISRQRRNAVPGEGAPRIELMFVGEAPGADEDAQGRPFVGRAGQLLTKMIQAIKLQREEVFIANVLRCRPPNNRPPATDEVENCRPFLEEQIAILRPKVICALGSHACQALLSTKAPMYKLRNNVYEAFGAKVVPTYHPAYLLRTPSDKVKAWDDLKRVAALLGRPV